ncbi:hypothetical protein KUTeg_012785 [Tegillarca granosa]|uniref:Uncharacterized protein n=1 Tax=Tegillarca granosa TaxID=220873 RepID=A0ABQ9F5U0_TEGGR|nr:hypothetical protein KUTeg_012785 [Tegillarca granosa]
MIVGSLKAICNLDDEKKDYAKNSDYVIPGEATPTEIPDMNNPVQYRGLPTPPFEDLTFTDSSLPPPCPRQLYGQSGIYDVIPGQQDYMDHRTSKAPPPPKRNPDTRLSRTSSASSDTYDDTAYVNEFGRHSQHSPVQSPRQPAMSPVHSPRQPSMSPLMQVKHAGQPLSPSSNASKPFSYITNLPGSPKQKRRNEGHQYNMSDISPNDPTYEDIGQAVHYTNGQTGRNSITGQGHMIGQVSPGNVHGHVQMSPKALRKSTGSKMSPVLTKKHSDRRSGSPSDGHSHVHGHGHMPPSFPAPPPPLPVTARFVAAIVEPSRSPSPPLPPPPPELQGQVIHRPASPVVQQHLPDQPPPPPPISKIPGRSCVSSFELGKKSQPESVPTGRASSIDYNIRPENVAVPNRQQISSLASEINRVKLKPGVSKDVDQSFVDNQNLRNGNVQGHSLAAEIGKVKLAPVTTGKISPDKTEGESQQILKPKLRPTGPKPWEIDIDDLPPPPPPVDTELPPPPVPDMATSKPVEIVPQANGFSKQKKENSSGDNPSLSGMDINLDEIDVTQIPGYTVITAAVPNWKRDMVEKKNKEKLDEYIRQLQKKKAEAEKWKNVPEWKRKLMEEKEKAKEEQEHAKTEALKQQKEKAQLEAEERKRQEKILQREREEEMRKELEDVPEWKREIMMKRGGELRNWGDEREEENKDD